jgi:hypothetical protein
LDAAAPVHSYLEEITLGYQRSTAEKNNNKDDVSKTATDNGKDNVMTMIIIVIMRRLRKK